MTTDHEVSPIVSPRARRLVSGRRRLVVSIITATLVVLLAFGALTIFAVRHQLLERVDRDLRQSTSTIDAFLTPEQFRELLSGSDAASSGQATVLLDANGRRVLDVAAGTPSKRLAPPRLEPFTVADLRARAGRPFTLGATGDDDLEYRVLVTPIGDEGDLLIIAAPLSDVTETLELLAKILLVAAAAAVAVLSGLIWLFSRTAIKPIDDMIDVAGAIGQGDLSARIEHRANSAEVAHLADALNSMVAQLEVAFEDKKGSEDRLRRFAADASHDLRTPLTNIQGWADLYHAGGRTDPDLTDRAMDRISREAARMASLVEDLLLLARLDQRPPLEAEPVDLSLVLTDAAADLRATDPGRRVTLDLPDGPVTVIGDEARLRRVVTNLVSNISAHTDPRCAAHLALTIKGEAIEMVIQDEGPGINAEDAERVFDRFYRAEGSRTRSEGGSGLGLAIAQSVIDAHGGTTALDSAPGAGARFTITIPRAGSERPTVDAAAPAGRATPMPPFLGD